ncbi:MAG: hypothetical protein AB7O88_23735 [Reyranellaceae bacterium]
MTVLRAMGIGRDPDDERTLFVIFDRAPSDDEMRAVHDRLRGADFDCPDEIAGERPFAPVDAYDGAPGEARDYAAQCAIACGKPGFRLFLAQRHGLERPLTEERATQKVRSLLGITSRRELNGDGRAAQAWRKLAREFEQWRRVS